jgi:uncharacterized protein YbaP (TraB family)
VFYFILCFLISFPVFSSDSDPYATIERKPTWAFKLERQVEETDGVPTQQQLIIYGTNHDCPIDMIPLRALEVIKTCDALYIERSDEKESSENARHILKEREVISSTKYQDFYKTLSNEAQEALTYLNSIRTEEAKEIAVDIRTIHPGFHYYNHEEVKNELLYQNGMDSTLVKLFKEQKKHTGGLERGTDFPLTFAIDEIFSSPFYDLENTSFRGECEKMFISEAQPKKEGKTPEIDSVDDSPSRDILYKTASELREKASKLHNEADELRNEKGPELQMKFYELQTEAYKLESEASKLQTESYYKLEPGSSHPELYEAYEKVDMNFFFKAMASSTSQRNINWIEPTIALAAKHKLACIVVGACHVSDSAENPEAKSYLKLLQENGFSISQMYTDGTFEDYLLQLNQHS